MHPVFQDVLLLCPDIPTGGPEALHQLAHAINGQSGSAKLAYYGPHSRLSVEGDMMRCDATKSPMPHLYQQYQPQVLQKTRVGPSTLIVYPEVNIDLALRPGIAVSRRALWWLSVDNAIAKEPRLTDQAYRRHLLTDPDLIHLYQSDYARQFLENAGVRNSRALSDYTDPQFIEHSRTPADNPPIAERRNVICFFPNKGLALARQFVAQGALQNQVEMVPIVNMTKAQVRDTLFGAWIYIDFGHHPGKDRVPREASIAGAVILLHAAGAANCPADHPLAAEYRFTEADISSGKLHRLIDAILENPQKHVEAQSNYRQHVMQERERFEAEVRAAFFADA